MGNNINTALLKDNIKSCSPLLIKKSSQREKRQRRLKVVKYLHQKQIEKDSSPVVDTLGLSNELYFRIMSYLSCNDLAACMLVCKEWRSLIDRCVFLREYISNKYNFSRCPFVKKSFIHLWKCTYLKSINLKPSNERSNAIFIPRVFDKFPMMWSCGIVVPRGVISPIGSILTYHYFIKAMNILLSLYKAISDCKLTDQYAVFMIPWKKVRLPASCEILSILDFNERIIEFVIKEKYLTESEMRNYYNLIRPMYNKEKLNKHIYDTFISNAPEKFIVFDCFTRKMEASPAFIASKLSDEWVGGILYAV